MNVKALVIPDCHLKGWMFHKALEIAKKKLVDVIVVLGDLVDDWDYEINISLYEKTIDDLIEMSNKFHTKICLGNHDFAYLYSLPCSGFSSVVAPKVCKKLIELISLADVRISHRIDNLIFVHGGITISWLNKQIDMNTNDFGIDEILEIVNYQVPKLNFWTDDSPIWVRPQYKKTAMFGEGKYIQVVGHTPVNKIEKIKNVISCDVFSTRRDGSKIGNEKFLIIDTISGNFNVVSSN